MKDQVRALFGVLMMAALAGCAGTNFKRPDPQSLVVGKSTSADVTRVMGTPLQTGELIKNEKKLKTARYAYAEGAGKGKYPGVVPARAMVFYTFDDVLVGQEFVSSFPEDATDFDETKVQAIIKGKSTRDDVIALLGKPNGEVIYPMIKSKNEVGSAYSYSHAKGSVFDMKFHSKVLVVSFDSSGLVTEVDYQSTGEK